jgi:hypothetical protein
MSDPIVPIANACLYEWDTRSGRPFRWKFRWHVCYLPEGHEGAHDCAICLETTTPVHRLLGETS